MPDFGERNFCSDKIFIPPSFPSIMKGYCKAAIRTQPYDLLRWSAAYFRALANGESPPVKERLEFPSSVDRLGLTPGYLKVLINQLGKNADLIVTAEAVSHKWLALSLPAETLDPLMSLLEPEAFLWLHFVAVAAGSISSSLTQTMILLCELLTDDAEGGKASIPVGVFLDLYQFLAYLDCPSAFEIEAEGVEDLNEQRQEAQVQVRLNEALDGDQSNKTYMKNAPSYCGVNLPGVGAKVSEEQVQKVIEFMEHWADRQDGMVMPRNIRHWMCPPMDNSSQLQLSLFNK